MVLISVNTKHSPYGTVLSNNTQGLLGRYRTVRYRKVPVRQYRYRTGYRYQTAVRYRTVPVRYRTVRYRYRTGLYRYQTSVPYGTVPYHTCTVPYRTSIWEIYQGTGTVPYGTMNGHGYNTVRYRTVPLY
jgi:hypothetical protein